MIEPSMVLRLLAFLSLGTTGCADAAQEPVVLQFPNEPIGKLIFVGESADIHNVYANARTAPAHNEVPLLSGEQIIFVRSQGAKERLDLTIVDRFPAGVLQGVVTSAPMVTNQELDRLRRHDALRLVQLSG